MRITRTQDLNALQSIISTDAAVKHKHLLLLLLDFILLQNGIVRAHSLISLKRTISPKTTRIVERVPLHRFIETLDFERV